MTIDPDVAKTLLKAADWLEIHNWCQFTLWQDAAGHAVSDGSQADTACAAGAIRIAAKDTLGPPRRGTRHAIDAAAEHVGVDNLTEWNDTPGRTKEHLIRVLREAAQQ